METSKILCLTSKEKINMAVSRELYCLFCYPRISKFMRCLGKKGNNRKIKILSNSGFKVPDTEWETTGRNVRTPTSNENPDLYFTYESRDILKSFSLFLFVKTFSKMVAQHSVKFEIYILNIIRCGSRSPDNADFGHFTLLFCRGQQRNVPRIITHVHSYCSAH